MTPCEVQLLVLAKDPVPGRVKTRLCPPCSPDEAASIARAALDATLDVVVQVPARRRVLVLEGSAESAPPGVDVIHQRGRGLDERLANAFQDAGAPSLLIGMDTPQITPELLTPAMETLIMPGTDAVLGPALDGGYWAVGLRSADARAFIGIPMSVPETFDRQLERLRSLGLRVELLPPLVDVDRFEDAVAVAAGMPGSELAAVVEDVAGALEEVT